MATKLWENVQLSLILFKESGKNDSEEFDLTFSKKICQGTQGMIMLYNQLTSTNIRKDTV